MLHIYEVHCTDYNGVESIMGQYSSYDEASRAMREMSYDFDSNGVCDWEIVTLIEVFV